MPNLEKVVIDHFAQLGMTPDAARVAAIIAEVGTQRLTDAVQFNTGLAPHFIAEAARKVSAEPKPPQPTRDERVIALLASKGMDIRDYSAGEKLRVFSLGVRLLADQENAGSHIDNAMARIHAKDTLTSLDALDYANAELAAKGNRPQVGMPPVAMTDLPVADRPAPGQPRDPLKMLHAANRLNPANIASRLKREHAEMTARRDAEPIGSTQRYLYESGLATLRMNLSHHGVTVS